MTAITVTPEMVRVAFLRRIGRSSLLSLSLSTLIISEFEGIRSRLYLAAACILTRLMSLTVGDGVSSKVLMISLRASFVLNV